MPRRNRRRAANVTYRFRPGPSLYCSPVSGSIFASDCSWVTRPRIARNSVPKTVFDTTICHACARLTGVPRKPPAPTLGSLVINAWPALNDTEGSGRVPGAIRLSVALGEFTPIHRCRELAASIRS